RDTTRRYPVLYVHDGEGMGDGYLSVPRSLDALVAAGAVPPTIVVGIGMSNDRDTELSPPVLQQYARLVADVVKPVVDASFRTRCGRASTSSLGYSLGGLAAFYLPLWYPEAFGSAACMSTSFWKGHEQPRRDWRRHRGPLPDRLWIDVGTREPGLGRARRMRDAVIARGLVLGRDLGYFEDRGARHDFDVGGRRMPRVLRFLLSAR
ncbi:MAG: hypothetical protein IT379_00205, partial [Deltaproteobacteria bacterium]|nr:hypothetical protein [Deltaproteobacteria bacterium]